MIFLNLLNKYYEKLKTFIRENLFFLLSIIVIVFLFTFEIPYVIYTPGGSIDLSSRIEVEGGYESKGSLSMAYVSMMKGTIPFALFSYVMPNWDLVPTENIKPDNESLDEMILSDRISMMQAQNHAILAAFSLAGKPVSIRSKTNHIVYISDEASTDLKLFDVLLKMNDKEIDDLEDVKQVVSSLHEGDEVSFLILRNGEEMVKTARVYPTEDGLKVGISLSTTYEFDTDPSVVINSKSSESGPSGGLMMALSIYNAIVKEDITNGKHVIGTGTIDENGVVGKIGGVKYKLLGAEKKKADLFLVPAENYEEAMEVKKENDLEIQIVSVETLQDAIIAMK